MNYFTKIAVIADIAVIAESERQNLPLMNADKRGSELGEEHTAPEFGFSITAMTRDPRDSNQCYQC